MDNGFSLARVAPVNGLGMILIRAEFDQSGAAITKATGLAMPGQTRIVSEGGRSLGWMAPDELLLTLPLDETEAVIARLEKALGEAHHLVLDVSDMRCVFDITGEAPDQVLAKLTPTDFDNFPADGLRRTRLAQIAAAFWPVPDGFRVVAFRSVAIYLGGLLEAAATPGSRLEPR